MQDRRTFATLLFALYLIVAAGLPLADALVERGATFSASGTEQSDREPTVPHDETCALCGLLDRLPLPGTAAALPPVHEAEIAEQRWFDPAAGAADRSARSNSARAPPLA